MPGKYLFVLSVSRVAIDPLAWVRCGTVGRCLVCVVSMFFAMLQVKVASAKELGFSRESRRERDGCLFREEVESIEN